MRAQPRAARPGAPRAARSGPLLTPNASELAELAAMLSDEPERTGADGGSADARLTAVAARARAIGRVAHVGARAGMPRAATVAAALDPPEVET